MKQFSRRTMNSLLGAGSAGVALSPLTAAFARGQLNRRKVKRDRDGHRRVCGLGFGELAPKLPTNGAALPVEHQGVAFISLPPRFHYAVISMTGQLMDDGNSVAAGHDGMAAFRGTRGRTLLVRNHELRTSGQPVVAPLDAIYNPSLHGGTSNLEIDARGKLVKHYNSLGGTERNCAGGPTPWKTWLSCEETFATRDGVRHGYVFAVPCAGLGDPMPLIGLGRFNHEAAAVDPKSGYVYLTEDRGDSVLYRFRPAAYGDLKSPGQLEALRLLDWPNGVDTKTGFLDYLGVPFSTDWVPVNDFNPSADTCRQEAQSQGAAVISRGEGCWYGNGLIYFCSSNGGNLGRGQIFAYNPHSGSMTLFIESTDADLLDAPDNITVGPKGRLYMYEDGGGQQNIVGANRDGELFIVASNVFNGSEFAGGCFSHDGRFMFVNIQNPGLTLVIQGPWHGETN